LRSLPFTKKQIQQGCKKSKKIYRLIPDKQCRKMGTMEYSKAGIFKPAKQVKRVTINF
jgi:hypothetical protein